MNKVTSITLAIVALNSSQAVAMSPQPDPNNPDGYIVSRAELNAAKTSKTLDPMYAIWSKALETRDNAVVERLRQVLQVIPRM